MTKQKEENILKKKALKNNKTLYITKDKEYEMCTVGTGGTLVIVKNDIGDDVIMSKYDFDTL